MALADPSREPLNVLVVGVGGQGVIMVSKLLALLAQKQGYEVKQSEVHGMAKRGGAVFSHVRFGRRVWSPTIPKGEVDVLIALEWAEGLRWLPYLKPDTGIFICDTKRIVPPFACRDRRPGAAMRYARETPAEVIAHVAQAYAIDATRMAEELGNERAANVVLLGALSTALHFPVAEWEQVVAEFVPKKTVAVNIEAFRRGRSWIEQAPDDLPEVERLEAPAAAPADAAYRVRLDITAAWCKSCDICVKTVSGALPASERGAHRGARRAGQMHGLPAVRMVVSGLCDPRASRSCERRRRARSRPMNAVDPALTGKQDTLKLISGNNACALGAIAAGCRFFAGYPITPSSEIAERLARRLPELGGVFVQMEDEIASMAAVIGASMGGVKAMTATSGPGLLAEAGEHRLRRDGGDSVRDRQRDARRPQTGLPTSPAQADLMQARWGTPRRLPEHRARAGIGARDL